MKKNLQIISLFVTLSLFSCNSTDNQIDSNPVLNADFPVSGNLKFKPFSKYDILEEGYYTIEDSVLWYFIYSKNDPNLGYCFDLKTGVKLSSIGMKGEAANELPAFDATNCRIIGDSIQLSSNINILKTFAKKDIIENKPMNERKFSVVTAPDSIKLWKMVKLPNGSIIATLGTKYARTALQEKSRINDKSVVIFNDDKANSYETIKYDSFDLNAGDSLVSSEDIIKNSYTNGRREIRGNEMAAFTVYRHFILYTFDINSGNVVNEKRYTKILPGLKGEANTMTRNAQNMEIAYMKSNDKYIFCVVKGYFTKKDVEAKLRKWKLFVFDWDLNPIKRFDLPYEKSYEYIISNDGKSVYIADHKSDGLILSKADIDI